ncbi:MAG TPA: hypothetical protein VMC06_15410 [Opitutaceae bacterium]|nr:hypothetical protein [Opitutaceae bacterium]
MQYKVITICCSFSTKRALEKFTQEVNTAIAEGWEPLGGIACSNYTMAQAMIKRR